MALPKEKVSKARGRSRRANWKLNAPMECSRSTAMRLIGGLLEQDLITKDGAFKNVRYVLK